MAKLKISEKYQEYKKKKTCVMKKYRQKKKMSEVEMPAPKLYKHLCIGAIQISSLL